MKKETKSSARERERSHLRRFAAVLPDFPNGQLDWEGEKPDIVVHTHKGDLGIEHTQLFQVEGAPGIVLPQAQEKRRQEVMWRARSAFEESGGGMLQVYAMFSIYDGNSLNDTTVKEASSKLADVVRNSVQLSGQELEDNQRQDLERWSYNISFPNRFPSQIDRIWIRAVDRPGLVIWAAPESGMVPSLTAERIQKEIDRKDQKITSYLTRCDEVWLLMVAENALPSSYFDLPPDVAELTYRSRFNRVFYFEHFDSRFIELKIARE